MVNANRRMFPAFVRVKLFSHSDTAMPTAAAGDEDAELLIEPAAVLLAQRVNWLAATEPLASRWTL